MTTMFKIHLIINVDRFVAHDFCAIFYVVYMNQGFLLVNILEADQVTDISSDPEFVATFLGS